jgi:hypothetical protein
MTRYQLVTLALAIAVAACMVATGIFIAERSAMGIIASLVGMTALMGAGFRYKKKNSH